MTDPEYSGCDMTREIARFLGSQAVWSSAKGRYEMNSELLNANIIGVFQI